MAMVPQVGLIFAAPPPKVLNNFVTELLNSSPRRGGRIGFEFENPREGWVFVQIVPSGGGKAVLFVDGREAPLRPWARPPALEAFRLLPKGRHRVEVACGGGVKVERLIVRAVPEILYAKFGYDPWIRPFGPYDWNFLHRHILHSVTTIIGTGEEWQSPFASQWKAFGGRWIVECGVPGLEARGENPTITPGEAYRYWAQNPGLNRPEFDGLIADEFLDERANYPAWVEAIRMLARDFPGKVFFPYLGTSGKWFYTSKRGKEFVDTVIGLGFKLAWERYIPEQATEAEAQRAIRQHLSEAVGAWAREVPGFQRHLIVCLGVFSCFPLTLSHFPDVDFKAFLDMQFRHLATDPAFEGTYGIMGWTSGYMEEETARWLGLLYRHYCIEGRKDPLSERFGFRYKPGLLRNPDFEGGLEGWEVEPAEEGSIRPGRLKGYGWLQGRWPKTERGDAFLLLRRSARRPNLISQRIEGVEAGRLYSVKLVTADRRAVEGNGEDKAPHALSIEVEGADVLRSFQFVTPTRTIRGKWLHFHWLLFRPKGTVVRLLISDWKSRGEPGGPEGQELMLNFVEVQPYFGEEGLKGEAERKGR